MFSLVSAFISRFPLLGPVCGSLVGSHALCFLCRSVSWAELIPLMLPSPHSLQIEPGDWPPRWAPRSLYLNPADSNKHTNTTAFHPADGLLSKQRLSGGDTVALKLFPDEWRHQFTQWYNTGNKRFPCFNGGRPTYRLCWLSVTFTLTLAPVGVVGPEPLSHKSY